MGSKRRKLLIGSYLSLMLGVFAVWSPALAETKIGVIATLTGPFARYGAKVQAAVSAVKSDSVSMVFENEGCEPKVAVSAFKKLSEVDRVRLFIGPGCGSPQSAIAPLLSRGGQLAVLGSSAPRGLFRQSDGRMFSTQPSIEDESTFLGNQLSERGVNSVVIVFSENGFSRAHEAAFRASYRGKILETFAYTSDAPAELKSIALKIKQLNAEALYVPDGFPLLRGFGRELRAIGAERPIYSVYSAQS